MPLNELLTLETLVGTFLLYLMLEMLGFVAGGLAVRGLSLSQY
jgi:hypothetical protein